jgi:hypothetical protein
MRLALRIAFAVGLVAAFLPLGGCLGFLIGYEMGSGAGHLQGERAARRRDDVERWVLAATGDEDAGVRRRALEVLRRAYRSPTSFDPADVRRQADRRLVRIAETLDDPDPEVRAAGRLLVRTMVGETVDLSDEDERAPVEAMTPPSQAPNAASRDDGTHASSAAEPARSPSDAAAAPRAAYARACEAARRAYGLARLGDDLRPAAPLLRRGLGFRPEDPSAFDGTLPLLCALALHAVTGETDRVGPVLLAGLGSREDVVRPGTGTGASLFGGERDALVSSEESDLAIAAAIGLGRLGAAGRPALERLRRVEGRADLPLREAAATARRRIEAAGAR